MARRGRGPAGAPRGLTRDRRSVIRRYAPARCAQCGQRTDTARLTFTDIWQDLTHSFVNIERGPLAFARALLTRPGGIAREHVEGKRRRHYGPFATLAVIVGFMELAISGTGFQILSQDGLPPAPTDLLQRHFNLLLLAQLPLLGLACALLFRSARLTLPEHMVLVAYTLSVRAVFIGLIAPLAYLLSARTPGPLAFYAFWAGWYVYFGWAASQFYAGPKASTWLRGIAAAALGHAAIMGVISAGSAAYEAWLKA